MYLFGVANINKWNTQIGIIPEGMIYQETNDKGMSRSRGVWELEASSIVPEITRSLKRYQVEDITEKSRMTESWRSGRVGKSKIFHRHSQTTLGDLIVKEPGGCILVSPH